MTRVLSALFEERIGGPQLRVLQVARGLRNCGVETLVAIPKGDGAFAELLRQAEIPLCEFNLARLRRSFNPAIHAKFAYLFWPNVQNLRRIIREHKIDVVHTNGLMHLQAAVAARLESVPLVWHLNDTYSPWPIRKAFVPLVHSYADHIAITSQAVGEYYALNASRYEGRISVQPPPVDVHRFHPGGKGSAVRDELGIGRDSKLVGTVANICPGKGFEYLIDAAAEIKKVCPKTKFLIVGSALENRRAYWAALMRQRSKLGLEKDVIFTGERNDIPQIMQALDLYVHPSESESFGMSILEAGATGLPVVATAVGGVPEAVEAGVSGLLVESRQPKQLADAVVRIFSDSSLARRLGEAGRERMCRLFSLENCVEAHLAMYKIVLSRMPLGLPQTAVSDEELKVRV